MVRLVGMALVLSVSPAQAATFVHKIYSLNTPQFTDCEARVDAIARDLASALAVDVTASFCEVVPSTGRQNGVIAYESADRLNEVSTYTLGSTYAPKGVYGTQGACEAALTEDVDLFRSQTGLTPVYAFCNAETLRWSDAWYPYITAFGEAQKTPRRVSWNSDLPHGTSSEDLMGALGERYAERSMVVAHLTYHDTGASGSLTALYYASSDPIVLSATTTVTIPGLSACADTAARIRSETPAIDGQSIVTAYCTSGYSNPSRFELVVLADGMPFVDIVQHSRALPTHEECEAARPSVASELRAVHGDSLVTTICGHPRFSNSRAQPYFVFGLRTL